MSPSGAATAGVLTHLSCLSNLAGLNAIVGSATDILDGVLQVLVYKVIWFSRAIVALAIQLPPGGVARWPERPPLDAQAPAAVVCADPPRTNAPQIGFWVASHGEVRP